MNPCQRQTPAQSRKKKTCGCGFKITFPDSPTPDTLWATYTESPGLWGTSEKGKAFRSPILGWRQQEDEAQVQQNLAQVPRRLGWRDSLMSVSWGQWKLHELLGSQELGKGNQHGFLRGWDWEGSVISAPLWAEEGLVGGLKDFSRSCSCSVIGLKSGWVSTLEMGKRLPGRTSPSVSRTQPVCSRQRLSWPKHLVSP